MRRELFCFAVGVTLVGCAAPIKPPDLGGLYSREAKTQRRNPVIVIPGILGSKLVDEASKRVVWGAFSGDYANPETAEGARLVALPMREGATLAELRDEVRPDGVLDRVRLKLVGVPVELQAYVNILATLGVGGYRDQLLGQAGAVDYGSLHYTCFQFDYDWRRDNVENAKRLAEFIREKRAYCIKAAPKDYGFDDPGMKFDIVAHSMGGLITRYFLMYGDADLPADGSAPAVTWAGAKDVERVVLIGTPNGGSVEALNELVNGAEIGPFLPTYSPAVLGTMPSVYQLMPRGRHGALVDATNRSRKIEGICDPALWERMKWGLAAPGQERTLAWLMPNVGDAGKRRRIAVEHQAKCLKRAEQFAVALDTPAVLPDGLNLYLFAGDAVETNAVAAADAKTGKVWIVGMAPGDGTVLRTSALMDERVGGVWSPVLRSPIPWTGVNFLFANHLDLTKSPAFSDNVLYLLLESPRSERGVGRPNSAWSISKDGSRS